MLACWGDMGIQWHLMGAKGARTLMGSEGGGATSTSPVASTVAARHPQLLGTKERTLDDRGRLSIPTSFRWAFVDGVALVPWPGPSLALIPTEEFLKIERKMRRKQRDLLGDELARDALTALSTHTFPDSQGRIFVPANLRDEIGITSDLLVVGRVRRIELWAPGSRGIGDAERLQALFAHVAAEAP